jgi:GGDEF domain-containing protein
MLVTEKLHGLLLHSMQRKNRPVTFRIGLISFLNPPESVSQADAMMYSVKQKGKNSMATRVLA